MGHAISAVVLRGEFDRQRADEFDLKPIATKYGVTIFPLDARFCDYWEAKLDVSGFVSDYPLLNCRVVHHMMQQIAPVAMFAVIQTDYHGGVGQQWAAVYQGDQELMPTTTTPGGPVSIGVSRRPINKALRLLGVRPWISDAFTAIGLHHYRDWDDLFEQHRDR